MIAVPEHHVVPAEHVELSGPHYFNAHAGMACFAGATERIRVNSCINILPLQHPIVTAKSLSTIDWLSGGRVTITFAVGWLEGEFEALGVDFHQRGAIADEYIQAIVALWTAERPELGRAEEHTSELQSLMRISYDVFCLKKQTIARTNNCLSK